jgi:hypothetical protein
MADCLPIASSGPREPVKRPRPVPKIVKDACLLMVYGDPEDEDGGPIDFITAAKSVGMRPDTLRRYLGRPQVIAFLRAERRTFREAVCAGNEAALQRVRDGEGHSNPMARVAAVRALEALDEADTSAKAGQRQTLPGLVVVVNAGVVPPHQPPIDITPDRAVPSPSSPTAFGLPASQTSQTGITVALIVEISRKSAIP